MPNMSYCRFQNTVADLEDCIEAIENGEKLSPEEFQAYEEMVELVQRFNEAGTPDIQNDDDD